MKQKIPIEEVATTTTTRLESEVAAMLAAVAWDCKVPAASILTPMIRVRVTGWFNELPEEIRRRFVPESAARVEAKS